MRLARCGIVKWYKGVYTVTISFVPRAALPVHQVGRSKLLECISSFIPSIVWYIWLIEAHWLGEIDLKLAYQQLFQDGF